MSRVTRSNIGYWGSTTSELNMWNNKDGPLEITIDLNPWLTLLRNEEWERTVTVLLQYRRSIVILTALGL